MRSCSARAPRWSGAPCGGPGAGRRPIGVRPPAGPAPRHTGTSAPRTASAPPSGPTAESASRVWFTIRHGAFTEIFYPRADQPAIRDLGLVVTDGSGFCLRRAVGRRT